MNKILLKIGGMSCSACSNGLEKYLNKQSGITNASVNLVMANALIEYDESILNQKKIEKFVKEAGFESLGLYNENEEEKENKTQKINFIIFTILSIILLYISMGTMIGLPDLPNFSMHHNSKNYAILLTILSFPYLIYGFDIIKSGYKNLIHKTPNMDTLVGIGVISSFLYSLYGMFMILKGNHEYVENLYFESAAIVIFFIKLGRYIDGVSKDRTKDAIKRLVQITPNEATIKIEGKEKKVTIDEIKKGDIVVSYAGDRIAVDGEIVEGKSHLDEAFITGESKPVTKSVGNKVIAGSINYDGYLEYKAERIGKESTISEIVRIVMEATSSKAPIAKIADKISGYFVPIIIVLAIITFGVYLALDLGISNAVSSFVTVLVIACPCSLGLATPLAIVVSEGVCAENGILVKKSEILENAMKIDRVVFDKTGTLTYGNLKVSKIYNFSKLSDSELMQIAGSIETKSTHPISKAFTEYLKENKLETLEVSEFENKSGFGIKAKITNNEYHLGNSKMVSNLEIDNEHLQEEEILAEDGNSIVYVIENKEILGLIGINDIIRDTSKELISNLKECKIEPIMLTGDNIKTAEKIAKEIGITNIIANVLPTEKADKIKNLQKENRKIMMVGDGINDSPALAISDIGVSITSGTDIAMDSSDVILMKNDLSKILSLIKISKKTIRNIKQNLFWAFFYNVLMIPIAMGVLKPIGISINPMIAGLAMTLSSLTVILNASRLKYIKF